MNVSRLMTVFIRPEMTVCGSDKTLKSQLLTSSSPRSSFQPLLSFVCFILNTLHTYIIHEARVVGGGFDFNQC